MFDKPIDDRLSSWIEIRHQIDQSNDPLEQVWEFWKPAPFVPYNRNIDPYNKKSWPTPWEIILHNKYDDFTKALMIGWTLKLTKKFKNSKIQLQTFIDKSRNVNYNITCIDEEWAINYSDNGPVLLKDLPKSFLLENLVELEAPR